MSSGGGWNILCNAACDSWYSDDYGYGIPVLGYFLLGKRGNGGQFWCDDYKIQFAAYRSALYEVFVKHEVFDGVCNGANVGAGVSLRLCVPGWLSRL